MPGDGRRGARTSAPRLLRAVEINRVLRTGTALRSLRVIVFLAPGNGPSRAAWVAGRRVGRAVARNRARRLLRQAWWELAPRMREGHEVVLLARGPLAGAKAPEVTAEIEGLLRRAGVMRDES